MTPPSPIDAASTAEGDDRAVFMTPGEAVLSSRPMTDPAELFNDALTALEAGRPADAVALLARVQALEPADAEVANLLADVHLDLGDARAAEAALAVCSAAAPDDVDLLARRAELRLEAHDPRGAAALLTSALRVRPGHARALGLLGDAFNDAGALAEAARAYRLSLDSDPFNADVWHNLAVASTAAGDASAAVEAWDGFLRVAPAGPEADAARAERERLRAAASADESR